MLFIFLKYHEKRFQNDKNLFEKETIFSVENTQIKFHSVTKSVIDRQDIALIFEKISADPLEVIQNISLEKNIFFDKIILIFKLKLIQKNFDEGNYLTAKESIEELIGFNQETKFQLPMETTYIAW